jgi:catechol 2,3-dioxygenase-like lactoylglutathione lyase family enzyme
MSITLAVPLLRVSDVAQSLDWYHRILGFTGDPFPAIPPYEFAILRKNNVEIMIRRSTSAISSKRRQYDWDLYLRVEGNHLREMAEAMNANGVVTRRIERMFYGLAEFEITDPDGNVICLSEELEDQSDLPEPLR